MPAFLFMPDSFKGTLSALKICQILEDCAQQIFPQALTRSIPAADGGEGSCEAFLLAAGSDGERRVSTVCGPYGRSAPPVSAQWALFNQGQSAMIETASCAGLPLAGPRPNPKLTTTYGVGELIAKALDTGTVKEIILGLGGSATNDGGCGMAAALGVRFSDHAGRSFVPTGGTLRQIEHIDLSGIDQRLLQVQVSAMCDIDNPLYGPNGAACIFGPQKGADAQMVQELDAGLRHLACVIERELGLQVSDIPGAGAAGGLGAGCIAFLHAGLKPGIDCLLDAVQFEQAARKASCIITGEGCLDGQSLQGKVVLGIARRAKAAGCPVVALVGGVRDEEIAPAYQEGLNAVFTINRLPLDFEKSRERSAQNLRAAALDLFALMKLCGLK
ncbi:MAG: glycerate kinase [Proteobacteria bacterium]|uniref:Glycerate kinase n=1 Tax=Candidatus Avisuccinivibrio stercorigallinarum TaxID=2840704 RepID=A0A9D9D9D3_9GAMM|nr:glycerate kinase [Candidatus Avisuccinivibrio stercorigallinarum]